MTQAPPSSPNVSPPEASVSSVHLETPTRRGDVAMAAACLAFGLIGYFFVVPTAVYVPEKFAGTVNSPDFLPRLFLILLSVFSTLYLVKSIAALKAEPVQEWAPLGDWTLAGGTALICIAYVAAIFLVGLTLASAACVAATIWYFGERRPAVVAAQQMPATIWSAMVPTRAVTSPQFASWAKPGSEAIWSFRNWLPG